MSTLTDLGQHLQGLGIATQGTDLFLGSRPDSPDTCVTIYQYTGSQPDYVQDLFQPSIEKPQVQIVTRALSYEDAEDLAYRVWAALSSLNNTVLSGTRYLSVRPNGSPAVMGRDTNDRSLIFFNASVEKEVSVATIS